MKSKILKDIAAPLTQEETAYTAVSPKTGTSQCANCRFFLASNYDTQSGMHLGPACVLVNNYPEPILATGWCNKWELRKPYEPEPLEVEIVEGDGAEAADEPAAEAEVVTEKAFKAFIAPKDIPVVERLFRKMKSELQPGTTLVRKGNDRYMLIVSSNGFEDRHDEHVATRALKEYVAMSEAGTVQRNKHTFWHEIEVGEIVAAGMVNGFLVEIAKEVGETGRIFYDYVEAHPDGWGASMGFWVRRKDVDGDTFQRIDKEETATLPRDSAANEFTLSAIGEDVMARKKFEELADEIFGKGTAKALEKGTGALKKQLLTQGKVLKQEEAVIDAADAVAEATEAPPETAAARDDLLLRMIDGIEALLTEVKATMSATEVVEEKADAVEEEVKSLRKEVTDSLNEIRQKLSLKPRIASQDKDTELDGDEAVEARKKLAPAKTQSFGGLELEPTK